MSEPMRLVEVDVSTFNRRFRVELNDGAAVEAVLPIELLLGGGQLRCRFHFLQYKALLPPFWGAFVYLREIM